MTKQEIDKAYIELDYKGAGAVDFAVSIYNRALDDAQRLIGIGTFQISLDDVFHKIESLRIE